MDRTFNIDALDLRDNLLFGAVMEKNKDVCRRTLETILGFEIAEVLEIRREMVIEPGISARGVRLDVRVRDTEGRAFDIEIQKSSKASKGNKARWLLRRARYYQSALDVDLTEKGTKTIDLPELYVIFICDFDPLEKGLRRYTVTRVCEEDGQPVDNGVHELYLCCSSGDGQVSSELDSLLRFIGGDDNEETELVRDLKGEMAKLKSDESWRANRMTLQEMLDDERELGLEQGREQERELAARLVRALRERGREGEIADAMLDPAVRERLLEELGIG